MNADTPQSVRGLGASPITVGVMDDRVQQIQFIGNGYLEQLKLQPIVETGYLDAPTCWALSQIVKNAKAGAVGLDDGFIQLLTENAADIEAGCAKLAAQPAKPQPTSSLTAQPATPAKPVSKTVVTAAPKDQTDPCLVEFGDKSGVIKTMQQEMNKLLPKDGYELIPVSSVWDPKTCGALFVLAGKFDPSIPACGGGYWSVPARCASQILPKKKAVPKKKAAPKPAPAPEPKGFNYAGLALGGIIGLGLLGALSLAMKPKAA